MFTRPLLAALLSTFTLFAFAGDREPPASWNLELAVRAGDLPTIGFSAIDPEELRVRDAGVGKLGEALQFAEPFATRVNVIADAHWDELDNGDRIGRLRVEVPGATDINIGFDEFWLPQGARLHLYDHRQGFFQGGWSSEQNKRHGEFWSPVVPGDTTVIEIYLPAGAQAPTLVMGQVAAGYRDLFGRHDGPHLSNHGNCNIDVVCPEGDGWRDQIRSAATYSRGGSRLCSGQMVNDVPNSLTPYFLTADHCGMTSGNASSMVVYWNYEAPTCGDQSGGSLTDNQSGATLRASRSDVDMSLLELDEQPDQEWNIHYSGWDRSDTQPGGAVAIHHPRTHVKSISFAESNLNTIASCIGGGTPNTHWEVPFWDDGTTEPGSSGSGIWNPQNGRLIGFLSGGLASCSTIDYDCYGKFSVAWDGSSASSRMHDWLDPDGINPDGIDGSDQESFTLVPEAVEIGQCGFDDLDIGVDVTQAGAFSDPVTLSAVGLPVGVTAAFSPNPVTPPGSSVLTLGELAEAGTGIFDFAIEGAGGGIDDSAMITLSLSVGQPGVPAPNAPANGAGDVSLMPTLGWTEAAEAMGYELQIATDDGFTAVVYAAVVDASSHEVSDELDTGTGYFWRVRGVNDCGVGPWSATYSFTTRLEPVADFSVTEFWFTVQEDDVDSDVLQIANIGTGNLTWSIDTDLPDALGLRSHDPALDEPLDVPDFTVTSPANGGSPEVFAIPAGVATRGEVVGFSFVGTATGQGGSSTWASDTCMVIESPDGTSYAVGGINGTFAGCDTNDWDFQGSGSTNNGTYTSAHDHVLVPAAEDAGDWTLTFVHDWDSTSAADITWTDVTVTLHKQPLPVCFEDVTAAPWLSTTPASGSVPESNFQNVAVNVNTTGMAPGNYLAYLCVTTNDVSAELVPMPVELEVTERLLDPPVIGVDPLSLSATVDQGDAGSDTIEISNSGEDTLEWVVDEIPAGCALPGWVGASPVSGSVSQGGSETLTVTFDAAALEPGGYQATLCLASNDPSNTLVEVDMALTVAPTTATIEGIVTGLGHCQLDPSALDGALVQVDGQQDNHTTTTNASGSYSLVVPAAEAPVLITASRAGHRSDTANGIGLVAGETQVVDFDLVLRQACATASPLALVFALAPGEQGDVVWTLSNADGGDDLGWSLATGAGCHDPAGENWMNLSHTGGTVVWGNELEVTVSADSAGLEQGLYTTTLCISTSDAEAGDFEVPVELEVRGADIFHDRFESGARRQEAFD